LEFNVETLMKKYFYLALICAAVPGLIFGAGQMQQSAQEANVEEAKGIVKSFFGQLKGELQAAMKQGGPTHAILICQARAPAIAQELSNKTGWEVGRTSLKLRNPANAPDAWELAVLEKFEARKAGGEDPMKIAHAEVVEQDGGRTFRFMKAIPTGKLCLACHGTEISPEVAEVLDRQYPSDQARGFREGDLRGAFTLTKPL
jgi:hypothetical protein